MKGGARPLATLLLAVALGAAIWGLSPIMTGGVEPWDAEGVYYPLALALAGTVSGGLRPSPRWAHYAGACIGQIGYELLFLEHGPLLLLGALFLLGYGLIFLAGAALAGAVRNRLAAAR